MVPYIAGKLGFMDVDSLRSISSFIQGMTKAKVQRCSLIAFGFLMALSISPVSVLCLTGSIAGAYYLVKDYEDPREVESMRKRALFSDFFSIIREHDSIFPVLDAKILTQKELSKKLDQAIIDAKQNPLLKDQLPLLEKYQKQIAARQNWVIYAKGLL